MNINDAYDLTMSIIKRLQASGIPVDKKPSASRKNPKAVEKLKTEGGLPAEKWFHITFYPETKEHKVTVHETARYLGNLGITFDTGGACNYRDWEIDWSFSVSEVPDLKREKARDDVENIICNLPEENMGEG